MGNGYLPLELSSFVGRAAELERMPGLLRARRLVTITGPGGIGKTRLGLRAAATLRESWSSRTVCEHLVGACAELAVSLLRAHADVHVLATRREVLHVAGERLCRCRH